MNKKVDTALLLMAATILASCSTSKHAQGKNDMANQGVAATSKEDAEDIDNTYLILSDAQRNIVEKNNEFAFKLFNHVVGLDSRVVSPMSVSYLMGMLANGAVGETQQQIMKTIGCEDVSLEELNGFYKSMLATADRLDKNTKVRITNYIAINKEFQIQKDFSKSVIDNYQAGIESLDFSSPNSTTRINDWCKEKTEGMIPSIIDQTDPSAISYLMNAIYFNGTWQNKFDTRNTKEENFQGYTRDIQKVEMMHQVKKFLYAETDGMQAVSLPYGNGSYTMTVLLPKEGKSVADILKALDAQSLGKLANDMDYCMVNLRLPKFASELELPLNSIISELGAPAIFNPSVANFSHFASGNFFVSKMLQKAKIEVSEQGTKAAAVTAAVMLTAMAPQELRQVEFHANHPFVYLIQERQSGAILFMGQFAGK